MTAVFLDRDGVLNENRSDYVKSWLEFRWLPGALDALVELAQCRVPVLVVTNQSMVGRGLASLAALEEIHRRLVRTVRERGGRIDGVYACPHTPAADCACRKPRPGLLHRAARQHRVDLARSLLIGDAVTDYAAARAAGARYIHVGTGRGRSELPALLQVDPRPTVVVDLPAAVRLCRTWLATAPATVPDAAPVAPWQQRYVAGRVAL